LYTKIAGNIDPLTADNLAQHAIQSARAEAQRTPQDGLTYLIAAKRNGIITPLMQEYVEAILAATGADSLDAALDSIQADAAPSRVAQNGTPSI
jgi:phage I-like protein